MIYIQVNLFAMILLCVMLRGLRRRQGNRFLTDQRIFKWLLLSNLVTLLLDSATCLLDGQVFPGAPALGMAATVGYYAMNPVMGLVYLVYCETKLGVERECLYRRLPLYCLPFAAHLILVIASVFRPVLFSLSADNSYTRGPLFPLSMVLSYLPVFYSVFEVLFSMRQAKKGGGADSRFYRSLLLFPVPPLIGGALQMATPEVSVVWASTVISMLIIFINLQNAEITTDALTGLFNRWQLMPYLEGKTRRRDGGQGLYVVLMDVNGFKQINDSFGHQVGDHALRQTAELLRRICGREDFLARYGGDEFILVAEREIPSDVPALIEHIRREMSLFSGRGTAPYNLSISAGCARWENGYPTLDAFIADADARMYEDKRRWKQSAGREIQEGVTPS
ncbi:MAG: GGDEF domain-containing protein [Agathobaculum sp.]|nr:GGDEF domain-containing protein [Agathobaculum sp.]